MRRNHLLVIWLGLGLAACTTSGDGLTLDTDEPAHVAGELVHGDVGITFDLSHKGDQHVVIVTSRDGTPLLETLIEGATETTSYFGGRLVVSGIAGAPDPMFSGDRAAPAELAARPERALLDELPGALRAAGVDPDLAQPTADIAPPLRRGTPSPVLPITAGTAPR